VSKSKCVYLLVFLVALTLTVGCGNNNVKPSGDNTVIKNNPNNANLATLDSKLAAINDEESALDAINTFANHVEANLDKNVPGNEEVKASALSLNVKNKFAVIEAAVRNYANGASAKTFSDDDLVSPDKLERTLQDVQGQTNKLAVNASQIKSTQKVMRETVPNLASSKEENMTPLEASIITYYMMTGDDGSNSEDKLPLQASQDKVSEFAERLVSKEVQ